MGRVVLFGGALVGSVAWCAWLAPHANSASWRPDTEAFEGKIK